MTSTFTPNKTLELPGFNDYVNSWNTPVNADFTAIDTALGGVTNLNVTALSGDVTLSTSQYRPIQIIISGTLTANVRYLVPASVGGQWTVTNSTTGAFTLTIASAAGGSNITLPSGTTMVSCDGTAGGMRLSITNTSSVVNTVSGGTTGLTPASATSGAVTLAGTLAVANGGTGLTTAPANGQIDIGNGTGFTRTTLTAGAGITITNGAGSIIVGSAAGGGTVTSVDVSGGTTGLTTSGGPVTTSGTITLAGTLAVGSGGTGITTTPANGQIPIGNGSTYTAATLTAGSGISITNGAGSVTLATTPPQLQSQTFGSSGTWTAPTGVTRAIVTLIGGGGGNSGFTSCYSSSGGVGGFLIAAVTVSPGTAYTVTIGAGGTGGAVTATGGAGGTTSFGALASATGGGGGIWSGAVTGANGTGTTTGTVIRNSFAAGRGSLFDGNSYSNFTSGNQAAVAWSATSIYAAGNPGSGNFGNQGCGALGGGLMIQWVG
jgi:hypothetical protein